MSSRDEPVVSASRRSEARVSEGSRTRASSVATMRAQSSTASNVQAYDFRHAYRKQECGASLIRWGRPGGVLRHALAMGRLCTC